MKNVKKQGEESRQESRHIIVVEDEASLRKGIRLNLEAEGFRVVDFADPGSALEGLRGMEPISLGIVDVMMPGPMDGFEFCRTIRSQNFLFPVIFLTARNRLEDKLEGFRSGGDDYITKPFDLEELLARVHARLRTPAAPPSTGKNRIQIGNFLVDLEAGSAQCEKTGKTVRFNERELGILTLLIENRGRPVSRDKILDSIWGTAEFPTNRTIDNYIVKFRKIFEAEPHRPRYFITRHGTGYELADENSEEP